MWCVQVRLRHDASFTEQNKRHEAVGAALDQELSVWRSVEEDPPHGHLTAHGHLTPAAYFLSCDLSPVFFLYFIL